MSALLVGHDRGCITPPVGVHMMGYAARTGPSEGIHDDLMANAVALSDGNAAVVILALDIASLDLAQVRRLKKAIRARTDLQPTRVLVNTSHTHAGPMVAERPGLVFETEYLDTVLLECVAAAESAMSDLRLATLSVGSASVDIGCNRRERTPEGEIILGVNRDGPRLAEATVWRFSRSESDDVVLFSIPVHGTTLGPENLLISAEWPGAAVRAIEDSDDGVRAVFLQGCAGDQNPYREVRSFDAVAHHGEAAGAAVRKALDASRGIPGLPLVNVARVMFLPLAGGGTSPCPIHGLCVGDAVLIGLGGEAFVEYALYGRKRSPASSTMVLGYTDGSVGYLPTEAAYDEGGYEPNAYKHFPLGRAWDPSVERVLKQEIDAMLSLLAKAGAG